MDSTALAARLDPEELQVVKERVAGEPHLRWECRCSPYYQNSALDPDSPEAKLRKLEEALIVNPSPSSLTLALSQREREKMPKVVPLFASLLSILLPDDRYPPLALTPQRQKQKPLEAVLGVLLALAAQQPMLFIVEDLHWIDASTRELLSVIIDQAPTARILMLLGISFALYAAEESACSGTS